MFVLEIFLWQCEYRSERGEIKGMETIKMHYFLGRNDEDLIRIMQKVCSS